MKFCAQIRALYGTFLIGGPSAAHAGYRELVMDDLADPPDPRHGTVVALLSEKFVLEHGLRPADEVELWFHDYDYGKDRVRQTSMLDEFDRLDRLSKSKQ